MTSYQDLAKANKISDPHKIRPGQKIKTAQGDYTVKAGDTLSGIAKRSTDQSAKDRATEARNRETAAKSTKKYPAADAAAKSLKPKVGGRTGPGSTSTGKTGSRGVGSGNRSAGGGGKAYKAVEKPEKPKRTTPTTAKERGVVATGKRGSAGRGSGNRSAGGGGHAYKKIEQPKAAPAPVKRQNSAAAKRTSRQTGGRR